MSEVPPPSADASVDSIDELVWRTVAEDAPVESAEAAPVEPPRAAVKAHDPQVPRRIGPYELAEEVGRGAFGTVYRAADSREGGREVAIKVFNGRMTTREAEVRFRREVAGASALDHPNISAILAFGVEAEMPYIVMRLIRGETLHEKIERDGVCSPAEAARILARLATAMAHAHSRNVIHRDLKPSNVILEQGEPVVVDFGLSKSLIAIDSFTGKGDLLGSPLFMAPEQLFGERADPRADVYGLGGLLYFSLTGQTPRRLEDFRKRLTPQARLPREVPSGLARICQCALHPAPERRYRSAAEMAQALERWLSGREIPEFRGRFRLFAQGLALLLLAALVFGLTLQAFRPQEMVAVFDQNLTQSFEVGRFKFSLSDGRQSLGIEGEPRFPCLRSIVDGNETWSPPAQNLSSGQLYLIGLNPDEVLTLRLVFVPGRTPIRARAVAESWLVKRPGRSLRLNLRRGVPGSVYSLSHKDPELGLIELRGELLRRDERGLVWGREPETQLRLSLDGQAFWSPPRPMDRTDYGVEYPLACRGRLALSARWTRVSQSEEIPILFDVMAVFPTDGSAAAYGEDSR